MPGPVIEAASWRVALDDYVEALALSPTGDRLVAGSLGGDAVIVATAEGATVATLGAHPLGVSAAAWSPDGDLLAVGGQDGVVHLYDPHGRRRRSIDGLGAWVSALRWAPDAAWLAIAAGRRLHLADPTGDHLVALPPEPSTVTDLTWASGWVGASAYGGVSWYDPAEDPGNGPRKRFDWKGSLLAMAVAPTGRWVCCGAQDASVHLWRLWSGRDLSMRGYPAKIERLAFRPDGRWLAVACLGEVTLWDFGGRGPAGTAPAAGSAHDRHLAAIAWEPSGTRLLTGGADGRLTLWPSPRRSGADLTPLATVDADVAIASADWAPDAGHVVVGRADGTVASHRVGPR